MPAGKLWCFHKVQERFGPDASYVVVGDGQEEEWAAGQVRWQRPD